MFFQLDTSMIHKAKLIIKTQLCNQEMVNTQLCLVNRNTTYLRMLRIYLMSTTTTNKETWFQQVINMIHRVKLIIKMQLCNQEMVNIQLCLVKKKIKNLINTSITTSIIIQMINLKFKLVLKPKRLQLLLSH